MSNTVDSRISASSDPAQEEIHLTELVPVEQSRIAVSIDEKDVDATDALKALWSLSRCNDNDFDAQFECCGDVGGGGGGGGGDLVQLQLQHSQQFDEGSKSTKEEDASAKRSSQRWKHSERICDDEFMNNNKKKKKKKKKQMEGRRKVEKKEKKVGRKARFILPKDAGLDNNEERRTDKSDEVENVSEKIDAIIEENRLELDEDSEKYLVVKENNNVMVEKKKKFRYRLILPAIGDASEQQQQQREESKKYGCVLCSARFKGTGGLRNHYKVMHAAGPLYKCDECGKAFPLKERLKLHLRTHTGFRPYKCNECDKTFARGGQLVQHSRSHSQVKPYRCNLCSGMFTCAANLSLHMKRHTGQKDHKCEICGRGFVRRDALKKHLECLHQDVKSFLCVICNKTFKGHLPQHVRTHAQDRPHGCATCGQRFAQKSQLTVHSRTHSGQRPFRCLVCWQAFAHSTALKLHTRRHTGERPFKCVECNAGFTQLPHWKKHMKCIHGRNEPYRCKTCKSFFRIKSELESHEKTCSEDHVYPKDRVVDLGPNPPTKTTNASAKFCGMSIEKMRLLLAVLLKRISKPEKLEELGFGKRLIDAILEDSLIAAGKKPVNAKGLRDEYQVLRKNLEIFLEWTVPQEHWKSFRKKQKTPEQILEALTAT